MKKMLYILLAAAAVSVSCAREASSSTGELNAEALEAYMVKYHEDAVKTKLGAYIYPGETVGTGAAVGADKYIRVSYTVTDRDGRFRSSTEAEVNIRNKNYNSRNYYGPVVWYRGEEQEALSAGLEQLLTGEGTELGPMKAGGTRTALIPGWLANTSRYDSAGEYIKNESGTTAVYTITLVETIADEASVWERDSLARYIAANCPDAVEDEEITDTRYTELSGGWYIVSVNPGTSEELLSGDDKIYCNYILSDLSGRVIDTNIEKVARDNGFYSSSSTYSPQLINWNEDYSKITMGSSESSVVSGFANAFLHMHPYETADVYFWSGLGYYGGSGSTIPAYCPLHFRIELTDAS